MDVFYHDAGVKSIAQTNFQQTLNSPYRRVRHPIIMRHSAKLLICR